MSAGGDGHFLECRDLHAYYGESYVIHGVSLTVAENEILTLLGRNGAGKTSTLRTIARAEQPALRSGEIHLRGLALHGLPAYKVARLGVALGQPEHPGQLAPCPGIGRMHLQQGSQRALPLFQAPILQPFHQQLVQSLVMREALHQRA